MARIRHVGFGVALLGLAIGCADDGTPNVDGAGSGGSAVGSAGSGGAGGSGAGGSGAGGSGGSSGSSSGGSSGAAGSVGVSGSSGSAGTSGAGADGGVAGSATDAGSDGGTEVCEPASRAIVLGSIGDLPCTALIACLETSCEGAFESAVGVNFEQGNYSGGICEEYVNCVAGCGCESECSAECRSQFVSVGGPCQDAVIEVSSCRMDLCQAEADVCED